MKRVAGFFQVLRILIRFFQDGEKRLGKLGLEIPGDLIFF